MNNRFNELGTFFYVQRLKNIEWLYIGNPICDFCNSKIDNTRGWIHIKYYKKRNNVMVLICDSCNKKKYYEQKLFEGILSQKKDVFICEKKDLPKDSILFQPQKKMGLKIYKGDINLFDTEKINSIYTTDNTKYSKRDSYEGLIIGNTKNFIENQNKQSEKEKFLNEEQINFLIEKEKILSQKQKRIELS